MAKESIREKQITNIGGIALSQNLRHEKVTQFLGLVDWKCVGHASPSLCTVSQLSVNIVLVTSLSRTNLFARANMCGSELSIPIRLQRALKPIEILGLTDLRFEDEEFD